MFVFSPFTIRILVVDTWGFGVIGRCTYTGTTLSSIGALLCWGFLVRVYYMGFAFLVSRAACIVDVIGPLPRQKARIRQNPPNPATTVPYRTIRSIASRPISEAEEHQIIKPMSSVIRVRALNNKSLVWKQVIHPRLSNYGPFRSFVNLPTRNVIPTRAFESPFNLMFRELEDLFPRSLPFGHSSLLNPFMEHFQPRALGNSETGRFATPRYEITEDDNEFKLAVDVPGVKPKDMKIKLEQDGRVLRLTGERKIQDGNWTSERTLEKAFLLDKKVETDKITANLSDGVVVITAPKVLSEQKNIIEIPITETTHASIPSGEEAENEINLSTGKN